MDSATRFQRLVNLIAQSKALSAQAPVACCLLQVLNALSEEETEELGTRHLHKDRHGPILDRLAQVLGTDARIVWNVLARSLASDLKDYAPLYAAARRSYEEMSVTEAEVRKWLAHQPPESVAFIYHAQQCHWSSAHEARASGLGFVYSCVEDSRQSVIAQGYLVVARLAFPTTIALLRAAMEQRWRDWQALWRYFG